MLMEHLDSLAGSISYKHMLGPDVETLGRISERGFYVVTASVDRYTSPSPYFQSRSRGLPQIRHAGIALPRAGYSLEWAGGLHGKKLDGGCC